ncbi:MAG TPA: L,D-transpeptidase family protein [Solirubrobacteraceae bacterium]|nr:L,D-transpeptidase family protein [Solirubrobacteraceae bacterium]
MRSPAKALLVALALAGGPLAASAGAQGTTVAAGVSAGGVDLSGLTVAQAQAKIDQTVTPTLQGDVIVGAGGRVFHLTAAQAGLRLDSARTAKRALYAATAGPVPLALSHAHLAVRAFVAGIERVVGRPAEDARVNITLLRIYRLPGKDGFRVDEPAVANRIDQALDTPGAARILHLRLTRTTPRIGLRQLPGAYPTVVTVDRGHFRLRLFKRLVMVKSYGIAVGRAGLATPAGLYHVEEREVNPSWHVPNSAWAGALAGQTIPPGPNDPIVARWLGLGGGIGIHGTNEPFSIGSAASHGCIRMLPSDVIALYPRVPLGTPVFIR